MVLSKQVCSLEQAKKLKELGIEQNSLYYFYGAIINGISSTPIVNLYNWEYGTIVKNDIPNDAILGNSKNENYSAFTVAELGVMLPRTITFNKTQACRLMFETFNCFGVAYIRNSSRQSIKRFENSIEAIPRADMLIYLLENKLITASDCNQRLNS